MKKKIFGVLQRIGRSFMLPIAVLPIAGMFLGVGSSLTNEATIASLGLESILGTGTTLNHILILLMSVGQTIFDNLPLIFAASVALGMAKKSKEVAVLSSIIAFFVMHSTIHSLLIFDGVIKGNEIVKKVAICPGSGKDEIELALLKGAKAIITGDVSYHYGIDSVAKGINVIDAGHYGIEHIFIDKINSYLIENTKDIEVVKMDLDNPQKYI